MNYIASCLFTTCVDPLRGFKWGFNQQIMHNWYDSGIKICETNDNIKLIVFHDGLTTELISQYNPNYISFIKVPKCGNYSPHDYRWFMYEIFAKNHAFEKIFFTDISDVIISSNPFDDLDSETIYMGDEEHHTWDNSWAVSRHKYYKNKLDDFESIFKSNSSGPFLNAGILGGHKDIVLKFLNRIVEYLSITLDKPYYTTDMIIFNYVIHKHFDKIKHGQPVNSLFSKNEIHRKDVWFIHK